MEITGGLEEKASGLVPTPVYRRELRAREEKIIYNRLFTFILLLFIYLSSSSLSFIYRIYSFKTFSLGTNKEF